MIEQEDRIMELESFGKVLNVLYKNPDGIFQSDIVLQLEANSGTVSRQIQKIIEKELARVEVFGRKRFIIPDIKKMKGEYLNLSFAKNDSPTSPAERLCDQNGFTDAKIKEAIEKLKRARPLNDFMSQCKVNKNNFGLFIESVEAHSGREVAITNREGNLVVNIWFQKEIKATELLISFAPNED